MSSNLKFKLLKKKEEFQEYFSVMLNFHLNSDPFHSKSPQKSKWSANKYKNVLTHSK